MTPRIELLKQAGFSDAEIGDWATAERQRMNEQGFTDDEIDEEFGVTRPPKEVPEAFIERLKQGNAASRIAGAAGDYAHRYFGDEPLGFSPANQEWLRKLGAAGDIIIPAAKPVDAVLRAVPAGLAALGAGFGQALEEAGDATFGPGPQAKGKAARDFASLAQIAALLSGTGRTMSAPLRAPEPKVTAAPGIVLPRAEDFRNAAAAISGTPASFNTEQKLLRLWKEHGISPVEVAQDAARDRTIAADLASDSVKLPEVYVGVAKETAAAAGEPGALAQPATPGAPTSREGGAPSRAQIDALGGRIDALRSNGDVAVDPQAMQRLMSELPVLRSRSVEDLQGFAAQALGLPDAKVALHRVGADRAPGRIGAVGVSGAPVFMVKNPDGKLVGAVKVFPPEQLGVMGGELLAMKTFEESDLQHMGSVRALGASRLPDGAGAIMLSPAEGETIDNLMIRAGGAKPPADHQAAMNELREAVAKNADALAEFHAAPDRSGAGAQVGLDRQRSAAFDIADKINERVAAFNHEKRGEERLDLDPDQLVRRVRDLAEGSQRNPGPAGPAHGDFHPGNVFYDGATGRITVIDSGRLPESMDAAGAPVGSPARDVATFSNALGAFGIRYKLKNAEIEELQRIFNRGYMAAARGPAITPEAMQFFCARVALGQFLAALKGSSGDNAALVKRLTLFKTILDLQ